MALQSNAALLDELMGKHRNVAPGACVNQVKFTDDDVCKYYLVEFCPHDLFVNTRADLGPCTKIHDDELKKQYLKSSRFGRLGYEEDYERFLRSLLNEVERKIRRGNERLKLTQNDSSSDKKNPLDIKREKVAELKEKINALIKEAESLGEEGRIDEAQEALERCEVVKAECKTHETQLELAIHNAETKQMEVCNICGSFLIINDAQSRIEEHNAGKQHQGYAKLRSALEDIRKKRLDELEKREKEREAREKEREKERERHRDHHRDRDRDRSRDRHRDRDRDRRDRRSSRSPSSRHLSKRNGSSSSSLNNHRDSRDRDRDRDRRSSHSDYRSKRTRSRSRSKDRKHLKTENGNHEEKSRQIEKETDEFLKLADDLIKIPEKVKDEEKEEGEADDDVDEGEIRGN
ncbi:unnamed protein product [Brachionus calyciflorus]|uniref:Luc7-like protein 3 n=1 Tax=Brachionus calyciflorus TaxID=104777 RepID=A0A813TP88_9BILA|nr:unnamed protein product [Brachionus calyciflorus]